jgi:hypothetical protein
MSTDHLTVTKLASDGLNWVTYRDRMTLKFRSQQWSSHFTSAMTPQSYTNTSVINGQTPDQRWSIKEDSAMDLIVSTVPDQIFNRVKNNTTTMAMWDAIKAIYQARSKMATINLSQKLQSTKLQDEGDAHCHGCVVFFSYSELESLSSDTIRWLVT